ncbi:hypothetical protein M9458_055374 [Cirrhinus mrigala]|uniref:ribonuclease H n=1 Tax=Cirrhinus mrigala TaxID=683832 RepID=A0ABD0MKF2_CIRMR
MSVKRPYGRTLAKESCYEFQTFSHQSEGLATRDYVSAAQGAAGWEQPLPCTSSSHRETQKQRVASHAPPHRERDQRHSKPGTSKVSGPDRPGPLRAAPTGERRGAPHSTVSTSPRCPQEINLPTLPVFQGAAFSSKPTPQCLLPGNVAELGRSPPLRGSSVTGHRTSGSNYTRSQSREAGSFSNYFGSVETTVKCICVVSHIRSEDWFVTIDLKDAYFHVSILPHHRKFLRFAFRGEAYQYRVLPFTLALSPRTFTKCVDAALAPLRLQGIHILNYIVDWLTVAQSEQMAVRQQEKCAFSITEDHLSRRGVGFDHDAGTNVFCTDRVDPHRSHGSEGRPVTHCQAVSTTAWSDGSCVQRDTLWPAVHKTPTVVAQDQGVLPEGKPTPHDQGHMAMPMCLRYVEDMRRVMLATDVGMTDDGCCQLTWHINCLEMLAVFQRDRHVLVRTDNIAVVYYINHQGGLRSRPLYKLAYQILVWSQGKLLSLRAVLLPEFLARLRTLRNSGECAMSLLVLSDSSSSPGAGCNGTDMAEASSVCLSPDCSALWSSRESAPGRGLPPPGSPVLAGPSLVLGPDFPPQRLFLGDQEEP